MLEVKDISEAGISQDLVFGNKSFAGHEEVVFCYDKKTGLKAIIAIHDTTLGPALGGTRMWMYKSESEALNDVLRLSRGMTFKAAISGLELGGGKAVIIGDSRKDKTPELFRKYGEFIDSLKGRYITAEDVGTSTNDMVYVHERTKFVTGLPVNMGGSGDPSPVTAYGVYMGMKASAMERWGDDSLNGKKIAVQGVGHVGENLVKYITEEGAKVFITDINKEQLDSVSKKYGAEIVAPEAIYDLDIDIYAPCALGATLDTEHINRLKCSIVAGAANNQLADEFVHGKMVTEKGILYAPDFLINAGGLINVYSEIKGYDREASLQKAKNIYTTTLEIFKKARTEHLTTAAAARMIAEERLLAASNS